MAVRKGVLFFLLFTVLSVAANVIWGSLTLESMGWSLLVAALAALVFGVLATSVQRTTQK
jgi:hypothetical protein